MGPGGHEAAFSLLCRTLSQYVFLWLFLWLTSCRTLSQKGERHLYAMPPQPSIVSPERYRWATKPASEELGCGGQRQRSGCKGSSRQPDAWWVAEAAGHPSPPPLQALLCSCIFFATCRRREWIQQRTYAAAEADPQRVPGGVEEKRVGHG